MQRNRRILIIDDDATAVELLQDLLADQGHAVQVALSVDEGIEQLTTESYDVAVVDLKMPRRSGIDFLEHAVHHYPELQVIMLTAHGSIESAVDALKKGAFDYLTKPIQIEELTIAIEKAVAHQRMTTQNVFLKEELDRRDQFLYETRNEHLKSIYATIENLRDINSTVLLVGESGTGKEMIARYIHASSSRASGSFVPINCGAVPEGLVESELFGYEKGAFTDAKQRSRGKLQIADGGTLFLDEINELSMRAQVALLRFLQERQITPLGSNRKIPVDVKIVAATNRELGGLVEEGSFREDLYYRINVIPLTLPPLRERREDIVPLAYWFLDWFSQEYNLPARDFDEEAEKALLSYDWPGNIRELRNVVERAAIIAGESTIGKEALLIPDAQPEESFDFERIGVVELKSLERSYIHWALEKLGGNRSRTARRLGISVRGLRYKLNNEENT
jgi:DNA-binding NtrC family response regulator